eukprot:2893003-Prymnesium_polylepis.2
MGSLHRASIQADRSPEELAQILWWQGAQRCTVRRSELYDVSASAVAMGRVDTWHVTEPRLQEVGNSVEQCSIHDTAREFHGAGGHTLPNSNPQPFRSDASQQLKRAESVGVSGCALMCVGGRPPM